MEALTTLTEDMQSKVKEDLTYWHTKLAHFTKTKNEKGIKVAKLLIDKYLDEYNNIK